MVAVVPHQGRKVEGHGQACGAVVQKVPVPFVRLLGRGEARELTHGPEAGAVHGRVGTASEREPAGNPQGILVALSPCPVGRRVERLDLHTGKSREGPVPRGRRLELLLPRLQLLP